MQENTTEVSARRRWYLENKDVPRIREGFRANGRRYYEKNKEAERERKRQYYHQKKAAASVKLSAPDTNQVIT